MKRWSSTKSLTTVSSAEWSVQRAAAHYAASLMNVWDGHEPVIGDHVYYSILHVEHNWVAEGL